jgi:membrane-bound lytic murein transglycosylase D
MLRRPLAALLLAAVTASSAWAQEDDGAGAVDPGVTEPPGPDEEDGPPEVITRDDGRRDIRGTPVDRRDESATKKTLRAFEEEAFRVKLGPDPGASDEELAAAPIPERDPLLGKDLLPDALRSPYRQDDAVVKPAAALRPEEVRPDLPWLQGLKVGDLPVRWDPRVIKYLEFYKDDPRGRNIMGAWLRDKSKFKTMILEALRRHGLPEDLIYLCMIESSYDPLEYSRSGASGLWQFMPAGGRIYGLRQDYWVDERNDIEKSTEAVMYYWKDLLDRFGHWHLALAAFNAGYGAVLKSIAKYNTNDFWGLLDLEGGLPWESSVYVPKALAAAIVGHNLEVFGYDTIADSAVEWGWDKVLVPKSVSLATVAQAAGVDVSAVRDLNPELRRGRTPAGEKDWAVRIPKGTKDKFAKTFPQLRGDWDGYDAYVMRHGERFEDVAKTHGLSVKQLRELNGVSDVSEVSGGTIIVVPVVPAKDKQKNAKAAEEDLYHSEVHPGGPDDPMIVPVPDKEYTVAGKQQVFYRVVAGDTVETVASVLGVRRSDVADWNAIDREAKLQPRMVLVAWVDPKFDADQAKVKLLDETRLMLVDSGSEEHIALVEGRKGRVRKTIQVKKGDTWESIAKKYEVTKYDLARINRRGYTTALATGDDLVVYEIVDRALAKKAGVLKGKGKGKGKSSGKAVATKDKKGSTAKDGGKSGGKKKHK